MCLIVFNDFNQTSSVTSMAMPVDFVCIFYIFVSSLLDFASFISFTFCVGNIVD